MNMQRFVCRRLPCAIHRLHQDVPKRFHLSFATQRPSPLLPSTKDEARIPRRNEELCERLSPLADLWGLPNHLMSLQNDDPEYHHGLSFLSKDQLASVLSLPFPDDKTGWEETASIRNGLYTAANLLTTQQFGDKVHYRGLLEFSNICRNDCNYCGIRKSFKVPNRYKLDEATILQVAHWSAGRQYGSIMLQSGEVVTPQRLRFLCKVIRRIVKETGLGVSLSVGELPDDYYEKLRQAGAKRYLLRIETSNPTLFAQLHPPEQTFEARLDRLRALERADFMVGTGIMIGLPGQTTLDLADDLLFFQRESVDMIGMGPYILQRGTPTADDWIKEHPDLSRALVAKEMGEASPGQIELLDVQAARMFELTTRMVALSRLLLGDVNIAATTALQTIHPTGREVALMRGANILMPILTPTDHRAHYQLYEEDASGLLDDPTTNGSFLVEIFTFFLKENKWPENMFAQTGKILLVRMSSDYPWDLKD
ncbi:[FeFe] hydrogenase maturase subunit HydE [Seminavis robusta]|uniref:[FeFe] hydrogenase maturase subunit HydE n=1 Tax=Seminavis robusta TaxID=568900 RepID=A0A9N8HRD9_9STRA|nr:[FeFe] hydrogenase maturase subunit HydE [Seminavis robusta]|eukprot:Sro1555_g282160.1 [FeFe] hydrogenase maturase subunit HydE (482) ;mRNA; r:18103-19834